MLRSVRWSSLSDPEILVNWEPFGYGASIWNLCIVGFGCRTLLDTKICRRWSHSDETAFASVNCKNLCKLHKVTQTVYIAWTCVKLTKTYINCLNFTYARWTRPQQDSWTFKIHFVIESAILKGAPPHRNCVALPLHTQSRCGGCWVAPCIGTKTMGLALRAPPVLLHPHRTSFVLAKADWRKGGAIVG